MSISTLHDICKDYGFCTPETRQELEENGFDFSACKFGLRELPNTFIYPEYRVEVNGAIPYPTFSEVWALLPAAINTAQNGFESLTYKLHHSKEGLWYENHEYNFCLLVRGVNICETACQMWLKLKKGGFLNGGK